MKLVKELATAIGAQKACQALRVPRSTFYYRPKAHLKREAQPKRANALTPNERQTIRDILISEDYCDTSVRQVYFQLLDDGIYLASLRSFYRILKAENLIQERRNMRKHPTYTKPVLIARTPNQVWTWDITELKGTDRQRFYLFVVLDLYSRYVVGWMVSTEATAAQAQFLVLEAATKQHIEPGSLTLHSDRGTQMTCGSWADLVETLNLNHSFSRPRVSNDNPFVESHFKTLKYRPVYPSQFASLADCRGFCQSFFAWYNHELYHSGIADLTPHSVHYGLADQIINTRQQVLDKAFQENPKRFNKPPKVKALPTIVGINHLNQEVTQCNSELI